MEEEKLTLFRFEFGASIGVESRFTPRLPSSTSAGLADMAETALPYLRYEGLIHGALLVNVSGDRKSIRT